MTTADIAIQCSGCGATIDPMAVLPFRCPNATEGDGIDHVLVRSLGGPGVVFPDIGDFTDQNPFIRYRKLALSYHLALGHGLSDAEYCSLVDDLDGAVARVDGRGFRVTPFAPIPALSERLGAEVWVKDETANVGGSHKARHLMGVMIYLYVAERTGLPAAQSLRHRRLAIASCGNAAIAAAVVAHAADWPLDVFIPPDAGQAVSARLGELGAECHVIGRQSGQPGDPCLHAFRQAVLGGSLGFGVQGSETGLTIEGGQTLGWEMADALRFAGASLDMVVVQVGGGALGTACYRGFQEAAAAGVINAIPRLYTVQTTGAYPLRRAFERFMAKARPDDFEGSLRQAARNRAAFMEPWPCEPKSVAHGIIDDETYDWLALVEGMAKTDGDALVVSEQRLGEANRIGRETTQIAVSPTGSAGLAGLMDLPRDERWGNVKAALLFTEAE